MWRMHSCSIVTQAHRDVVGSGWGAKARGLDAHSWTVLMNERLRSLKHQQENGKGANDVVTAACKSKKTLHVRATDPMWCLDLHCPTQCSENLDPWIPELGGSEDSVLLGWPIGEPRAGLFPPSSASQEPR